MEQIDIVICLDKNLLSSLPSFINSVVYYITGKWRINIICKEEEIEIFDNFIKDRFSIEINENIRINYFIPNNLCLEYCKFRKNSYMNLARFFIKDVFNDLEKIIYLDTDMLVLHDLRKLWDLVDLNSDNNYYAGCIDIFPASIFYINNIIKNYDIFLKWNKHHNGGLFVTNLKYWDEPIKKLYKLIERDMKSRIFENIFTEALQNIIFNNFYPIPIKWNISGLGGTFLVKYVGLLKYYLPDESPYILHWSGKYKPWRNNNVPFYKLWNKFNEICVIKT